MADENQQALTEHGEEAQLQRLTAGFEKTLNSHGYGFHYAVIQRAKTRHDEGKSSWRFEVAEFPVEVQGTGTRIDFILSCSVTQNSLAYILAECKRADPALANWCFAKAPYVRRSHYETFNIEFLERKTISLVASAHSLPLDVAEPYHIAFELKSMEKGQGGAGRGAIEEAAGQVLRGLNGMANALQGNSGELVKERAYLIPVVFTTANIWTTEVDLRTTDIESGRIDVQQAGCVQKPWIIYQYHQSPGLKHDLPVAQRGNDPSSALKFMYIRSIPIVSPSGIDEFLRWSSSIDIWL